MTGNMAETGIPLIWIAAGSMTAVVGIVVIAFLLTSRHRRSAAFRRELVATGFPLIVGRTALCSLCDTKFTPPVETHEWARCPGCRALVRL